MLRGMMRPTGNPGFGELFSLSVAEVYTYFLGENPIPTHTFSTCR